MKSSSKDSSLEGIGKVLVTPSCVSALVKQAGVVLSGQIFPPEDCFDHGNNSSTFLLVPGFCCNAKSMKFAGEILKEKYNVAYAPPLCNLNTGPIDRSVILLREKFKEVLKKERNGDVSFYCHSAGGVIVSKMLIGGQIDANTVFACASPFKGTSPASVISFLALPRQLQQNSKLIKTLDMNKLPVEAVEFHVACEDSIVPPENQTPWIMPMKSSVHYHHHFQHFDFIQGEKAKWFVKSL